MSDYRSEYSWGAAEEIRRCGCGECVRANARTSFFWSTDQDHWGGGGLATCRREYKRAGGGIRYNVHCKPLEAKRTRIIKDGSSGSLFSGWGVRGDCK